MYLKEEFTKNNDLIILYSGGADSRLLLEKAKIENKNPLCLLIDYNQLHKEELEKALYLLRDKHINFELIKLENFNVRSALTTKEKGLYGNNVSQYNVPNRNMILLSLGIAYAENYNINTVWYGANYSDRLGLFPDCYSEWIEKLNELINITTTKKIKVEAPLLRYTKDMVINELNTYEINKDEYFSGYGDLT